MKTISKDQLTEILRLHHLWLGGDHAGVMADLRGSDLREANLRGSNLCGSNLREANLRGSDLIGVNLRWADLIGANLSEANLRGSDLRDANLRRADLRWADLSGSNLSEADLRDADLSWEKTIDLSKHEICYMPPWVVIGCQCWTREYWLEHGKGIGKNNGYSAEEIAEYMNAITDLEES